MCQRHHVTLFRPEVLALRLRIMAIPLVLVRFEPASGTDRCGLILFLNGYVPVRYRFTVCSHSLDEAPGALLMSPEEASAEQGAQGLHARIVV